MTRSPAFESLPGLLLCGAAGGALLALCLVACAALRPAPPAPPGPTPLPVPASPPAASPAPIPSPAGTFLLEFPVGLGRRAVLTDSFRDRRGARVHHAVDILAPLRAPVRAADAGTVRRLLRSRDGGIGIEQLSGDGHRCFYYAHLAGYARGLQEGQRVDRGQLLGYVGTTGNAPARTPHLHFAVFRVGIAERSCFSGEAVDPYPLLSAPAR